MANYYWVGGNGTWNTTSTTNWSAASGGSGGAGPPTSADIATFDANSGAAVVTLGENVTVLRMIAANFTGTFDFSTFKISIAGSGTTVLSGASTITVLGSKLIELTYAGSTGTRSISTGIMAEANAFNLSFTAGSDTISGTLYVRNLIFTGFAGTLTQGAKFIYGDLTVSTGMTLPGGTSAFTFKGTSGTQKITSDGKTLDFPLTFDGVGGTFQLQDDLTLGSTRTATLTNGTLDLFGKTLSAQALATSNSNARTLAFGTNGTLTLSGTGTVFNAATSTGLSVTGTGTINLTNASTKTFAGGGGTYPIINQAGTGALTISGSNTFANITNSTQPTTITLTSGTTQTVTNFTSSGTAGNVVTLNASTPGNRATLLDDSNTVSVSYMTITNVAATGNAEWQAYTSNGNIDGGNNAGWIFTAPGPIIAEEYPVDFRSFTEKRRF